MGLRVSEFRGGQLHCFGPKMRQNNRTEGHGRGEAHCGQEAEIERKREGATGKMTNPSDPTLQPCPIGL